MGFLEKGDVQKLLQDEELMTDIAKAVVEDPEAMDDLAEDIADKLSDLMGDDPALRSKIVQTAIANPEFKKKIVRKLVDELG